jgi:uncharacterized membrane protein
VSGQYYKELSIGLRLAIMKSKNLAERKEQMESSAAVVDRMLVVVFDTEPKAYEGKKALLELENEGSIVLFAYAVIGKNAAGGVTVKQSDEPGPLGTLMGTALGSLIGLLGGPTGIAVGAATGLVAGTIADLSNARVSGDFVDDVAKKLAPGKFAVVAEVQENWTTPVDTHMEAIGGTVFRRALSEVEDTANAEDIAAMKADIAQLKAEHAKARADRKAKLQQKINELNSKIQAHLEKAKERRLAAEQRAKAKVKVLKAQAAEIKARAAQAGDVIPD